MSTKSQRVWADRYRNAEKLAAMGDGDEDKALDIIVRTIRYALARAREWERENVDEAYAASKHAAHKSDLLEKREKRMKEAWSAYGLTLVWYGLYPTVTDHKGGASIIHLAYMD